MHISFSNRLFSSLTITADTETNAETVWVTKDSSTLAYSDSQAGQVGFVDITDPAMPAAAGTVALGGEPTTVRIHGDYAVVGVNTSPDFINTSGKVAVIDIASKTIIHEINVMGQPDAIDVSKDEQYIAVAIENERDEDLGEGILPQMPAGFLVIIDTPTGTMPTEWTTRKVEMTGLDGILYPEDPEPEYVAINSDNVAVVTLQENNGIVLVDLPTGNIVGSYSAGEVLVDQIDTMEEGVINQVDALALLREPDGVTWIGTEYYAIANEGDMDGGSRGFTIMDTEGNVVYDSGNEMELWTARIGAYPEERSENKGNEPENIMYSEFDDGSKYLFVLSERSSVVFVYDAADPTSPTLLQILPAGVGPEGIVPIPSKNVVAVASEEDARGDKMRSSITLYGLEEGDPVFPVIISDARADGSFIPFAALSGLASASPYGLGIEGDENILYSIEDSFFSQNRVLQIDASSFPAVITDEMRIMDSNDELAGCLAGMGMSPDPSAPIEPASSAISDIINVDKTVNIDPEGIAVAAEGGFWLVSEGSGTVGDEARPFVSATKRHAYVC